MTITKSITGGAFSRVKMVVLCSSVLALSLAGAAACSSSQSEPKEAASVEDISTLSWSDQLKADEAGTMDVVAEQADAVKPFAWSRIENPAATLAKLNKVAGANYGVETLLRSAGLEFDPKFVTDALVLDAPILLAGGWSGQPGDSEMVSGVSFGIKSRRAFLDLTSQGEVEIEREAAGIYWTTFSDGSVCRIGSALGVAKIRATCAGNRESLSKMLNYLIATAPAEKAESSDFSVTYDHKQQRELLANLLMMAPLFVDGVLSSEKIEKTPELSKALEAALNATSQELADINSDLSLVRNELNIDDAGIHESFSLEMSGSKSGLALSLVDAEPAQKLPNFALDKLSKGAGIAYAASVSKEADAHYAKGLKLWAKVLIELAKAKKIDAGPVESFLSSLVQFYEKSEGSVAAQFINYTAPGASDTVVVATGITEQGAELNLVLSAFHKMLNNESFKKELVAKLDKDLTVNSDLNQKLFGKRMVNSFFFESKDPDSDISESHSQFSVENEATAGFASLSGTNREICPRLAADARKAPVKGESLRDVGSLGLWDKAALGFGLLRPRMIFETIRTAETSSESDVKGAKDVLKFMDALPSKGDAPITMSVTVSKATPGYHLELLISPEALRDGQQAVQILKLLK